MATYRLRLYEDSDGSEYYSLQKKTWFFWREVTWWHNTPQGRVKAHNAKLSLIQKGHIVF